MKRGKEGSYILGDCFSLQVNTTVLYIILMLIGVVVYYTRTTKNIYVSVLKWLMSVVLRTLDGRAAVVVPTKPKISSLDTVNVLYEDFRLQSSACHSIK